MTFSELGDFARWRLLALLRPFLRNRRIDKGKWFVLDVLNPKPGEALEALGVRTAMTRYGSRVNAYMGYRNQRFMYLSGEYEVHLSRLFAAVLSPQWRFIDVGANIGFHSLLASIFADHVISVEPSATTRELLMANLALNHSGNVTVLPVGLSDTATDLVLHQHGSDIGGAHLGDASPDATSQVVHVARGDDVLPRSNGVRTLLKIDVEGWEHKALSGMPLLLSEPGVTVVAEITDEWLRRTGSSASALFDFMSSMGFHAYLVYSPSTRIKTTTALRKLDRPLAEFQYDALFTRCESAEAFWASARRGAEPSTTAR